MLATTQTKPHPRRPHVEIKEPFKYKEEVRATLYLLFITTYILGAFYLDSLLG